MIKVDNVEDYRLAGDSSDPLRDITGERTKIFDEIENNYLLVKSPSILCILVSEIKNDEVALLLKLNVPAADLVCFLPRNPSQYIKISFNVDYILLYVMLHSF